MTVALAFAAGFVAGVAAVVLYSLGICWWLCRNPQP